MMSAAAPIVIALILTQEIILIAWVDFLARKYLNANCQTTSAS